MRIGQLARRLALPPSDIMAFLNARGIETEAGVNSRLNQDQMVVVVNHFAPEKAAEIFAPAVSEEPQIQSDLSSELVDKKMANDVSELKSQDVKTSELQDIMTSSQEEVTMSEESVIESVDNVIADITPENIIPEQLEVIRVSKVELQGLKVLGKIELPQPKKKDTIEGVEGEPVEGTEQSTEIPTAPVERRPRREVTKRNDRRETQRTWTNPLETKRQQEEEPSNRFRAIKLHSK